MSSSAVPYKNQPYAYLKKLCIQTKTLFEDPEFPADNSSLFYNKPPPGVVHWKRPREICKAPHLFVEGISSHDLNQGVVGNCWFVAACSCLALKPHLWKRVIPDWKEQEWDSNHPGNYAGIFHFQFWIFGEWIDVVVDDRLPTINGKLIYCHSKQKNEFWSALLEKAYAKLAGCYQSLEGGNTGDAVVDFSGAVSEAIDLKNEKFYKDQNKQKTFFAELLKVWGRGGIISCSIRAGQHEIELQMDNGLVKGHAYSVTAVKEVRLEPRQGYIGNEAIPLVRMRNPWGKTEWKGAWSDSSEEWSKVNDTERKQLGITVEDDGEFWMSFKDWCRLFTDADVCRLINTSMHFGSWTVNENPLLNRCGGCVNQKQKFLQNPQYLFDVTKESDEILISLQQQDRKIHRQKGQGENLTIGFSILRVELNRKYRLHDILTQECLHTSTYINARTVFKRCMLPQGRYVIIPTTFTPSIQGDYMLRLSTDMDSGCRELVKDKPDVNCWTPIFGYPQVISHIYVKGAEIHQHSDQVDGIELYVTISCEGQSVSSTIKKNTLNPDFEISAVFYRKKVSKPIKVQVWSTNLEEDNFLGQVVLPGLPGDISNPQELQLKKNGLNMAGNMVGNISLRIVTENQLTDI